MILSDNIIEKNSIFLTNLNSNATHDKDTWINCGSSYGMYRMDYAKKIEPGRAYWFSCTYKFTTTNQSPSWACMYVLDGSQGGPYAGQFDTSYHLTPNTEYRISGCSSPILRTPDDNGNYDYGNIYQGYSGAISGVTGYVKNVIVYDVTELQRLLQAKGIDVSTYALLDNWCTNNLDYVKYGVNYDITSLVEDSNKKAVIKGGSLTSNEFVEEEGMDFYAYSHSALDWKWFDTSSGLSVYNNAGGGTVTLTRVASYADAVQSPWPEHQYCMQVKTNGTASPGAGGFYFGLQSAANKYFICKLVAKIPVNYSIAPASNSMGTGFSIGVIGSAAGTGDWEEYTLYWQCGSGGTYSSGGHVYVYGANNTNVTWYVAYINYLDLTNRKELANYTVLRSKTRIDNNGIVFADTFDTMSVLPTGFSIIPPTNVTDICLNSAWEIDTEDYAGDSKYSLVQPVGKTSGGLDFDIPINPQSRYKLSFWVKCKGDMSSYLTAIYYYKINGNNRYGPYGIGTTFYKTGTRTKLTQQLNTGDTVIKVASNANWSTFSWSKPAFRSSMSIDYNDLGTMSSTSAGLIESVSSTDTITLKSGWTGSAKAVGTIICEAGDGGAYPYPFGKYNLPTDNTWKYLENTFGTTDNKCWDGRNTAAAWDGIPYLATHMRICLNLYTNNGSVPIKFSDIRVEQINNTTKRNKILIKGLH